VVRQAGFGTLLFDLLTFEEEQMDGMTGAMSFDVGLLAERLLGATRWIETQPRTRGLKIGYFGANTGGSASLRAASILGDRITALVSRGCRTDLVDEILPAVRCPTRLIVGGLDADFIHLNEESLGKLPGKKELRIIPGASHLFEEQGKLEQVARISTNWFIKHLVGTPKGG
jgi:pimeloyl-ACP methyl ester carboxylesterase